MCLHARVPDEVLCDLAAIWTFDVRVGREHDLTSDDPAGMGDHATIAEGKVVACAPLLYDNWSHTVHRHTLRSLAN